MRRKPFGILAVLYVFLNRPSDSNPLTYPVFKERDLFNPYPEGGTTATGFLPRFFLTKQVIPHNQHKAACASACNTGASRIGYKPLWLKDGKRPGHCHSSPALCSASGGAPVRYVILDRKTPSSIRQKPALITRKGFAAKIRRL